MDFLNRHPSTPDDPVIIENEHVHVLLYRDEDKIDTDLKISVMKVRFTDICINTSIGIIIVRD